MDAPIQRMLKIGKATVGLVSLDVALNRVILDNSLSNMEAADRVFEEISSCNYVPGNFINEYRQAILKEVVRLREGIERKQDEMVIRILGPGCVSCNNLQKMMIEVMNDLEIAADVFQVHDLDEIGRFGVIQTPALVINGKLKCSGRLPSRAKAEEWLREELP